MINLKIKTLDSNDHNFTVEDETTVAQLKDRIQEQLGVEIHSQRLIFCGRVMQDDKKLSDYGVNGKVIHMVQRPPPSVETRDMLRQEQDGDRDREREPDGSYVSEANVPSEPVSPTQLNNVRQDQIRRLVALTTVTQDIEIEQQPGVNLSTTAARIEFLRRQVAEIRLRIDELIRNASDEPPNYPDENEEDARSSLAQARVPNEQIDPRAGTSDSIGSPSSMRDPYHTPPRNLGGIIADLHDLHQAFTPFREQYILTLQEASDTNIRLDEEILQRRQRNAEITAEVFHSFSHAYHLVSDIALLLSPENSRLTSESFWRAPPAPAHMNLLRSMTRRPLYTGGNAQATQAAEPQRQQDTSQRETDATNDNTSQSSDDASGSPSPNSQEQTPDFHSRENRSNTLAEFENLFRGLGQAGALGSVEVAMSMEELPEGGARHPNNDQLQGDGAGGTPQHLGSHIILAQVPSGVPPTVDLIQNIMTAVIRQGLPGIPTVVQGHVVPPEPNQSTGQNQNRTAPQNENETHANTSRVGSQADTENSNERSEARHQQPSESAAGSAERAPPARQSVPIENILYDRFLKCDSLHARRQLQRRCEMTGQAGGFHLSTNSLERIQNQVDILFTMLDSEARDEESLMVASVVALREAISFPSGRTLMDNELYSVRSRLQAYVEEFLLSDNQPGERPSLDLLFERHAAFVSRMNSITPIRPSIDLIESVRAVLNRFLNEAISIFIGDSERTFVRKFRNILPRMFYELCGVISYCCLEGVEGLRSIYRSFMTNLIQNFDEPVRDRIYSLAIENLDAAIIRIESRKVQPGQFIRRRGQQASTSTSVREEPAPLETANTTADESLQTDQIDSSPLPIPHSAQNIHNCPTPPLAEILESPAIGIVPTISTFVCAAPEAATSATVVHSVPIVPTVTTIPNAPTYSPPPNPNPPRTRLTSQRPPTTTSQESTTFLSSMPVFAQTPLRSSLTPYMTQGVSQGYNYSQPPPLVPTSRYPYPMSVFTPPPPPPATEADYSASSQRPASSSFLPQRAVFAPTPELNSEFLPSYSPSVTPPPSTQVFLSPREPTFTQSAPRLPTSTLTTQTSASSTPPRPYSSPIVQTTPLLPIIIPGSPVRHAFISVPESSAPAFSEWEMNSMRCYPPPFHRGGFSTPVSTTQLRNTRPYDGGRGRRIRVPRGQRFSRYPRYPLHPLLPDPTADLVDFRDEEESYFPGQRTPISTTQLRNTRPYDGGRGRRIMVPRGQRFLRYPRYPLHPLLPGPTADLVDFRDEEESYFPGQRSSIYPRGSSYESQPETQAISPSSSSGSEILNEPPPLYLPSRYRRSHGPRHHGPNTRSSPGGSNNRSRDGQQGRYSTPIRASMPARQESNFIGNRYGRISYSTAPIAPSQPPNGCLWRSNSRGHHRQGRGRSGSGPTRNTLPSDLGSSDSSTEFVPPAQIAQHWGEGWVSAFTRDIQRQRDSSEPLSDAYLSGMPPKKRRCVRQSRPPATLDRLISESVSVLVEAQRGQGELRDLFRDHVRFVTQSRAAKSDDYDPERLQATATFLK